MESISMLPPQCNGVMLVAWGEPTYSDRTNNGGMDITWAELKTYYRGMKLVLNKYEELAE
eukprot:9683871-Ditylum_brightwellii.AAC.1